MLIEFDIRKLIGNGKKNVWGGGINEYNIELSICSYFFCSFN